MAAPRKDANGDGEDGGYRLSLTIEPSIRRKIRLAAAVHDMTMGEWASEVLERAADKAVEGIPALKGKV
jgi:predicted HicB family RNase H-like nuclease